MGQQIGGAGRGLQQVLSGVVITYLIAIGITFLMLVLSVLFSDIFPTVANPFALIYGAVRSITLFILMFPLAVGLIVMGFMIDLIAQIAFPVLNGVFELLQFPIVLPTETDFVGAAQDILTAIQGLIDTLFPAEI